MSTDHLVAADGYVPTSALVPTLTPTPASVVMATISPSSPVAPTAAAMASPLTEAQPSSSSSPTTAVTPPVLSHSAEARRLAGTILEVMAGVTSITDAALALGITPARYQQLELRAVTGLITACEPRPPGPVAGALLPAELERLATERDRLKAEVARYQTLARIAQGAFGTAVVPAAIAPERSRDLPGFQARSAPRGRAAATATMTASGGRSGGGDGKPRKKRTPTVRALRLAKRMRADAVETLRPAASTASPPVPTLTPSSGG